MSDYKILFVDDDRDILNLVKQYLSRQGYAVTVADNGLEALEMVREGDFDIVFTDYKMPEFNGLELLEAIKRHRPSTEVIIVTGHGTMESAIQAMKFGSYDYLQKPFKLELLKVLVDKIIEEKNLKREHVHLKQRVKDRHRFDGMLGVSVRMREVFDTIDDLQHTSLPVTVLGEIGTGKELLARCLHRHSPRSSGPFVAMNCRGAGAGESPERVRAQLDATLTAAGGGTLYLDELTDLVPVLQAELVTLLQAGAAGAPPPRIVAASQNDPTEAAEGGTLRHDLADALARVTIRLPPLRERREDIGLLILHFLHRFNRQRTRKIASVAPGALDLLMSYHWPGNVIQLENVIERAFALVDGDVLEEVHLPSEIQTFGEIARSRIPS